MPFWKSSLVGLALVVLAMGVALAEMTALGALVHAFNPAKHFDIYYALHQKIVVGGLIGVSLLWIFALHPWAKGLVEPGDQVESTLHAGELGRLAAGDAVVISLYQGPGAVLSPDRGSADEMTRANV